MTLQSFPRGGRKPLKNLRTDNGVKKKSRSKLKVQKHDELLEESNLVATTADCLTYETLTQGMVLLGRVRQVRDYDMVISLPGRLIGQLQLTDISESYTRLLENIINVQNEKPDGYKSLPELFKSGDYLVCYVKHLNYNDKWMVSLSLEPELINQNLDHTRIIKKTRIVGAVSSIEEHGYVIDTGVANLRTFLPSKDVDDQKQYYIGQQLFLMIKDIKTSDSASTITVSAKTKHNIKAVVHDTQLLDALVPGSKVILKITKVLSNGLQVSFNENNVGYVNQIYLDKPLSLYKPDMPVHGTLLYILPVVKFAYFSLLSEENEIETLNVGDLITTATVLCKEHNGILLRLSKKLRGFVPMRRTGIDLRKVDSIFLPETKHKCRVLNYDWFDRVYICSMEKEILKQKSLTETNFAPGDLTTAKITRIDAEYGSVTLNVNRAKGYVPPEHVSDIGTNIMDKLKSGQSVKVRVLKTDPERNRVLFTMKQSLVESKLPVLSNIKKAIVGSQYHGTIVQLKKTGLLIQFFGDLKGWVPPQWLGCNQSDIYQHFTVGQVLPVTIMKVDKKENKMSLSVVDMERKKSKSELQVGATVECVVAEPSPQGVQVYIQSDDDQHVEIGFLPAAHMSPSLEVASLLAARCIPGEKITAFVFSTEPDIILSRTFMPLEELTEFENLQVGHYLPCSVKEITQKGLKVLLPINNYDKLGIIPRVKKPDLKSIYNNQILFAKITSIDQKERKIELTIDMHELWLDSTKQNAEMTNAVDVLHLYLNKVDELSKYDYYKIKSISKASLGQHVTGNVEKVTENGLVLVLENNLRGTVRKNHYNEDFKVGDQVSGTIIWINYVHELVEVTLKPALVNYIATEQTSLSSIPLGTKLKGEIILITNWFILIVLRGKGKGNLAVMPSRRHLNEIEPDLRPYSVGDKVNCYIVLDSDECNLLPVSVLSSTFEKFNSDSISEPMKNVQKRKNEDVSKENLLNKKAKLDQKNSFENMNSANSGTDNCNVPNKEIKSVIQKTMDSKSENESKRKKSKKLQKDSIENNNESMSEPMKKKSKLSKTETTIEVSKTTKDSSTNKQDNENLKNSVSTNETQVKKTKKLKTKKENDEETKELSIKQKTKKTNINLEINDMVIPECGFHWDTEPKPKELPSTESSSDSEEETEGAQKQKKKKLSAAERRELERQKEREIREKEEALASNQVPNSVDQFDRLVMSSPDSSVVWVQYMAYHLQATEIEKARAVAKRAIKTINFREETEKLNVWQAWLNLESRFGTPETLNEVFQEAIKTNDAFKVYTHMLTLHADANRQTALEKTITTITGKFKHNPQAWIECGTALLKMGLKDKSRHVMQRALQSLPPHQHVDLMVRFAQLENRFGDKERGQTLFEKILSSYPKRVDVWSVYVDALIKSGDIPIARQVLERASAQTLPARKMKAIFKKFIAFEEKYGTPTNVADVQEMARDYVENQCQ